MKILLQSNIGSHYRTAIYTLISEEFDCDFCFGDRLENIKKIDYSKLKGKVTELHNVFFPHGYYQRGMLRMLRADYDTYIINGETRCVSTWLFLILRKLFYKRKRVFLWSHGFLGKEGKMKQLLGRFHYWLVDGAFIYNERSCRIMIDRGILAEKLHVVYNSLDYDHQLPIRQALQTSKVYQDHFGNENKNIVFIGRLTKVKRFDLLLDAVAKLKQQGELLNVTFIGDGDERVNMERIVEKLGICEQVWFYGSCYDENTNAELIYNADLCVSPGNIGLTAIHVMMFGCPAITNDDFNHQGPEFEAIHDGETGSFFQANNSASLAGSISTWFEKHKYNRETVRQACYREIDTKWNPHNQIRIIKEVLG